MLNIFCILSSFCCLICIIIMRNQIAKLFAVVEQLIANDVNNRKLLEAQLSSNETLVKVLNAMVSDSSDKKKEE